MDLQVDQSHLIKVIFLGDSNVGKTALLERVCTGHFKPTTSTVGVDTRFKRLRFDGRDLVLTLWDTAGQERYQSMMPVYYRGAQGVVFVFDLTSRASFESLAARWLPEAEQLLTLPDAIRLVIANKLDLVEPAGPAPRQVSAEEGAAFARAHGCLYRETSAKLDTNVYDSIIWGCVCSIAKTPSLLASTAPSTGALQLNAQQSGTASGGGRGSQRLRQRLGGCCGGA